MTPKGKPTTSTERMRAKRARELGLAPPIPVCSVCGSKLKAGAGSDKAYAAGMCWKHWKQSEEGKVDRRRLNLRSDNWAVGYVVRCAHGEGHFVTSARAAVSCGRTLGKDCLIAVVWRDGEVTIHPGLTSKNCTGLKPEDGDLIVDDAEWFHDLVPETKRTWFDS
jgi:hypothetical protein